MRDLRKIKSRYEFSFDNKQIGFILAGVIFVAILIFTLGVMVGRSVTGISGESTMLVEKTGESEEEKVEVGGLEETVPPLEEGKLTFYKTLPDSEEKPEAMSKVEETEKKGKVEQKLEREVKSEVVTESKKGDKTEEKVAVSKKAAAPSAKISAKRLYAVQVGAFRQENEAIKFISKLKAKGYEAYYTSSELSNGLWYRVRIGKYENKDEAKNLAAKIQAKEKMDTYIAVIQ